MSSWYCKSIKLTKEKRRKQKTYAVLVFSCIPMLLIMRRISRFDARGRFHCELYFTSPLKKILILENVLGIKRSVGSFEKTGL